MASQSNSLKALQENFKSHLVGGSSGILSSIVSTNELSNIDRLAIYANAYYARLTEVLESDFEGVHTLLGDDEFTSLCKRYIDAHPSSYYTLRWFGQHLPQFLKNNSPYSDHPYLSEMATFEWMFTVAFDAKDSSIATDQDVAEVPAESWPTLAFTLHPSVSWFTYQWNILPLWKYAKEEGELPTLGELDSAEVCLVWRQALTTKYRTLDKNEVNLIKAISRGKNFSQLCEVLVNEGEREDEVPMIAAGVLKTWLSLGMITAVNY